MKGSLVITLYYGYWHMIEFSEFNIFHDSHSVEIQEQMAYIHMVIIIRNVRNNLFIHVILDYDVSHGVE